MPLRTKDLLGIRGLSTEEITEIFELARSMKKILNSNCKKADHLIGKSVITLFYENSTRTRVSFKLATGYLSGTAVHVSADSSSVAKGETLAYTGRNLDQMGTDVLVIRHPYSGAPKILAENVKASVINAGDGMNEHPTQALLDMFTMIERFGSLTGLNVAIIGDVLHSRVARSNMWGLVKMGANVSLAGPPTLLPMDMEQCGVRVLTDVDEAIKDADVVMCLRLQKERQSSGLLPSISEYMKYYGVNEERLRNAKNSALLMHPGPMNPGIELSTTLPLSDRSVIFEQVNNGVAVRMAILAMVTGKKNNA